LVTGYNETANPPYFILQNSWGTQWGLNGYVWVELSKSMNSKGTCGVCETNSYPTYQAWDWEKYSANISFNIQSIEFISWNEFN